MFSIRNVIGRKKIYDFTQMVAEQGLELSAAEGADPQVVLRELGWTLYELDYLTKRAVFIDVGSNGDVIDVPFAYNAQMRLAKCIGSVSFDQFFKLADNIKPTHRLIQFYNIGHCGSTLLHNIFNAGGAAWDISEPKFVRDIAMHRASLPQEKQVALAKAGLAFLSLYPKAAQRPALALKHFSQATKIYDILHAACPAAKNIYMYRDAISWFNSDYGFWQRWGMPAPMPFNWRHIVWTAKSGNENEVFLKDLVDFDREGVTFSELAACGCGLHAREYLAARATGMEFFALRYNELLADREAMLKKLCTHCDLNPANVNDSLSAFDHDAHAGEKTSHEQVVQTLSAADNARIKELLRHPRLGIDPNVMF